MKLSKKLSFFSFAAVLITTFSLYQIYPSANAATTDSANATTADSIKVIEQISPALQKESNLADFTEVVREFTQDEIDEMNKIDEDEFSIEPLGVNSTANLNLAPGKSWGKSFKVDNLIFPDHNAFSITVSNVTSGKYKVIITGSNNFNYESSESSGDAFIELLNARKGETYTVLIVNTSSVNMVGTASIKSYIK